MWKWLMALSTRRGWKLRRWFVCSSNRRSGLCWLGPGHGDSWGGRLPLWRQRRRSRSAGVCARPPLSRYGGLSDSCFPMNMQYHLIRFFTVLLSIYSIFCQVSGPLHSFGQLRGEKRECSCFRTHNAAGGFGLCSSSIWRVLAISRHKRSERQLEVRGK